MLVILKMRNANPGEPIVEVGEPAPKIAPEISGWIIATDVHDARRQADSLGEHSVAQWLYGMEFPRLGRHGVRLNRQLCRSPTRAGRTKMDTKAEIAAGEAFIPTLPQVLDFALIGSASYLPDAADVDFAVLIDPAANAVDYAGKMVMDGWGNCGDYDGVGGIWAAVRRENLNLMVTHDPKFFADYKTAMEVCKALNLTHKEDRIAVCQIVRDGKKASDVVTHARLYGSPWPPALDSSALAAA